MARPGISGVRQNGTAAARRPRCLNPQKGKTGAPGRIRTSGPQIRSLVLYPAELRARGERGHRRRVSPAQARCSQKLGRIGEDMAATAFRASFPLGIAALLLGGCAQSPTDDAATAVEIAAPAPASDAAIRMTTIRDIRISGVSCCGQVGINVSNSQFIYIDRVRLSGFAIGIFGETAFSVFIANSSIHDNGFVNMVMGEDTTAWRVRDSVMSSGSIGVLITTTARGHVITGARIERNPVTGVWVNGSMNVIENSWFEGNGTVPTPLPGNAGAPSPSLHGIRITNLAKKTRILSNLFSSQLIGNAGAETKSCFNMSFAPNSTDVNQLRCR